jgi:hypothetical protein
VSASTCPRLAPLGVRSPRGWPLKLWVTTSNSRGGNPQFQGATHHFGGQPNHFRGEPRGRGAVKVRGTPVGGGFPHGGAGGNSPLTGVTLCCCPGEAGRGPGGRRRLISTGRSRPGHRAGWLVYRPTGGGRRIGAPRRCVRRDNGRGCEDFLSVGTPAAPESAAGSHLCAPLSHSSARGMAERCTRSPTSPRG